MKLKTKTFKMGGIHPSDMKLTAAMSLRQAEIPAQVVIPLTQHIGKPAKPVVAKGDAVKVGTLIAKADGYISANIHSSVSGTVKKIDDMPTGDGYSAPAIVIDVDGDTWESGIDTTAKLVKNCKLSPKEVMAKLREAGIVGMGGAMFPSYVKLDVPEGEKIEYLLINAVECEPYLTADHRLMLERGEEILVGAHILGNALGVKKVIIGVEENKPDAIEHLADLALNYKTIDIQPLKMRYPQGGEKQLIKAAIGREVPPGKLPLHIGAVVFNVATTFAAYEAVQKNKPLIDRVVTVTGKSVKTPGNLIARIGTSVDALLGAVGGMPEDTAKVIAGGPMMGNAISDMDAPVTKGTSGIVMLPEGEELRREESACIRCGRCAEVCCLGLEPFMISALVKNKQWDALENVYLNDCLECGSCSWTCPSALPLLDRIRVGKAKVKEIQKKKEADK